MAKLDPHSETWEAVLAWAKTQRAEAVDDLITDSESEKQRGRIAVLDELEQLAKPDPAPYVVADTYR